MGKRINQVKKGINIGMVSLLLMQVIPMQGIPFISAYANEKEITATSSNASHNEINLSEALDIQNEDVYDDLIQKFDDGPYDILIRMVDSSNSTSLEEVARSSQENMIDFLEMGKLSGKVESYESFYIVNGIHTIINSKEFLQEILQHRDVSFVTPNFKVDTVKPIKKPNSRKKRSIDLAGFSMNDWGISMVQAEKVWDEYGVYGEGTVVGIIDTGVNYKLPQLKNSYYGYDKDTDTYQNEYYLDLVSNLPEPSATLDNDHGTFVAGIIGGGFDVNFKHTIGIAPKTKFINVRALTESGTTADSIITAAEWMYEKKPDVINCSWGYESGGNPWFEGIAKAWRDAGIVSVFASGNTERLYIEANEGSIMSPANLFNVLAVGAIDSNTKLGLFSKRGPSEFDDTRKRIKPDLSAPGVNVFSIIGNGSVSSRSGTSYAAPHVTAIVALMRSVKPDLTVDEIENILKTTAKPLTDHKYTETPNMGYGYGVVDAYAAVTKVREMAGLTNNMAQEKEDDEPAKQPLNPHTEQMQESSPSTDAPPNPEVNEHNFQPTQPVSSLPSASQPDSSEDMSKPYTDSRKHLKQEENTRSDFPTQNNPQNDTSEETKNYEQQNHYNHLTNESSKSDNIANSNENKADSHARVTSDDNSNNQINSKSNESTKNTKKAHEDLKSYSDTNKISNRSYGGGGGGSSRASSKSGSSKKEQQISKLAKVSTENIWKQDKKGWRYLKKDGTYPKSAWMLINSKWYYFDEIGYATKGWREINSKWYYLNQDCAMETGWIMVQNQWYYLGQDGAMYVNTITPDGYKVDSSGAWQP